MVDSTPTGAGPPSTMSSIRPPRSAATCSARVGETWPERLADGATTGWEHVARLAAWSGADAWVTADGGVALRARDATTADAALRWGRELLAAGAVEAGVPASGVAAAGEGPGPADDRPGAFRFTATGAPPAPPAAVRYRPGLRATDVAGGATTAWLTRETTRRRPVTLETFLLPQVGPGDILEVQDAPVPVPLLQVRRVEHRVDAAGGRTRIVARAGADADLLGQLGGLLGQMSSLLANPAGALAGAVGGLL